MVSRRQIKSSGNSKYRKQRHSKYYRAVLVVSSENATRPSLNPSMAAQTG
jgi:hypothetical protein